jgi:hypothetical protein
MRNPEDIARLSYHLSSLSFGIIKNLKIEFQGFFVSPAVKFPENETDAGGR